MFMDWLLRRRLECWVELLGWGRMRFVWRIEDSYFFIDITWSRVEWGGLDKGVLLEGRVG